MDKIQLYLAMLNMNDVITTNQGIVQVPSYNGEERAVIKTALFQASGLVVPDKGKEKSPSKEDNNKYLNVEQEDV